MIDKSKLERSGEIRPPAPWWRASVLVGLILAIGAWIVHGVLTKHAPGCKAYSPIGSHYLVAHAGGGLPDRMYPNSLAAMDNSYGNGLRAFELDFHQLPFGMMRTGHDTSDLFDPRGAWLSDVLEWLERHPDTRLLVDMKTDNLEGLKLIAGQAPAKLKSRIVPYVYHKSEYEAVRALGFYPPVYALFKGYDPDWVAYSNAREFSAVALSADKLDDAPKVRHQIVVFTFDSLENTRNAGAIITNCMIPTGRKPFRPGPDPKSLPVQNPPQNE